jgi:UDP-3-O-[3-hydroxymyristoyl] glucosamine N-acyltransferase
VRLPAPVATEALVLAHGGALDEGARGLLIEKIVSPWSQHDSSCLLPVLREPSLRFAAPPDPGPAPGPAGVLLVDASLAERVPPGRRWVHPQAAWALAGVLAAAAPPPPPDERHLALVEPGALVHPSARLGAYCVVRAGASVGEGCVIEPHAVIYGGVSLGRGVLVGAGAVLGRPGFGWAHGPDGLRRMPQLGGVVIDDDVEVGPCATVDAGTLGPTTIGRGSKLDAHVHVGHNVRIGALSLVAAQSGFAGSVAVGNGVLIGGQAGVADHVEIGDGARLAGGSGVIGDVPPGAVVAGYPAVDRGRWLRGMASVLGSRKRRRP